jgi:DNA polymerase III alpha subunit
MKAAYAPWRKPGAFESLGVARRNALWDVRRLIQTRNQSLTMSVAEANPGFAPLTDFEEVGWDYRRTAHSARRHPLEPMRASLMRQDLPDARTVATMQNGEKIRYAGLVICRQRPGTAGGVVFMTLEDETGFVNVVDMGERVSALFSLGQDGELPRHQRQAASRRRRGSFGRGKIVGAESGVKTCERGQPGFSLKELHCRGTEDAERHK